MKNRIIKVLLSIVTTVLLIGCNGLTAGETTEIEQEAVAEAKSLYNWNNIEVQVV